MFELRRGNRLVSMWSKAHNDLKQVKNVNGFPGRKVVTF